MTEHITKDAVISLFEKWSDGYAYIEIPVQDAIRQVSVIPLADVRPVVKGHWERVYGDSRFMCSVCKGKDAVPTIMGEPTVWDFCPNCGSWMRGDAE